MIHRLLLLLVVLVSAAVADKSADDNSAAFFNNVGEPLSAEVVAAIRSELIAKIGSLWVNVPASTVCHTCLIFGWLANQGNAVWRRVPLGSLESALVGLPAELAQKIRVIAFSQRVDLQMFRFNANAHAAFGHYSAYLGVARRVGGDVEMAIVTSLQVTHMVPKYNVYSVRTCRRILFWKRCKTTHRYVLRGLHAAELARVETAMIAQAVRTFLTQANRIPI